MYYSRLLHVEVQVVIRAVAILSLLSIVRASIGLAILSIVFALPTIVDAILKSNAVDEPVANCCALIHRFALI